MATTRRGWGQVWSDRREAVARGLRDTRRELRLVAWPSRQTTINLTLVVIGLSIVLGIVLGGLDLLLARGFEWLSALFGGALGR